MSSPYPARVQVFGRLSKAMGKEDLLSDPRFDSMAKRLENAQEIQALAAQ